MSSASCPTTTTTSSRAPSPSEAIGTGAKIGHELTHGFDDEGRQFDAHGNLKDWWSQEDAAAFNERAQCIAAQWACGNEHERPVPLPL